VDAALLAAMRIVCPLVFLASAIDAVAGGGGLISLPAYLLTGMSPQRAGGTNKLSASVGTLTALFKYARGGKILWLPALVAALAALPGAYLGAELLARTDKQLAQRILLVALPAMAALIFVKKQYPERSRPVTRAALALCAAIGLVVGFYDGFLGPGTGTLLIMAFTSLIGMETVTASGSAKLVNFASNFGALAAHIINGNVYYALALPAMACSILGGYVGAHLAIKKGAKFVRFLMLAVVLALIAKLIWDNFLAKAIAA
jgi:uncharacterized membrane protein YfcA